MNVVALTKRCRVFLLAVAVLAVPSLSTAAVLTQDTVWQGEVKVTEDVLVPAGVTLVVKAGTTVTVAPSDSTKTEPEFLSPLTEITVRGALKVEGSAQAPVEFRSSENKGGGWAGIIIDRGSASISGCRIRHAENGVQVFTGTFFMKGGTLQDNRYGVVANGPAAKVSLSDTRITANDYGIFQLQGAQVATEGTLVQGNRKRDRYAAAARPAPFEPVQPGPAEVPVARMYRDDVLRGDVVWQGRVEVDGVLRVPDGSRLVILPGTVVEFKRRDPHSAGMGENGLLVQGVIIAKGTRDNPILFRSAEKNRQMGDWDAINIMNSSGTQNLMEYCRIQDAYRALHFHYANVSVRHSVLTHNYRAIQFQESQVEIQASTISENNSGVQGRDSDISFLDNTVRDNYLGANFFRNTITVARNRIAGNRSEGLRVREGALTLQENLIEGNRHGVMVTDCFYGDCSRNVIAGNLENGISLKNVDNLELRGNAVVGNGLSGLNLQEARAQVDGNLFSDNGERGIGVISFSGAITGNNFAGNGRYAIDLEGGRDVAAPGNWWGGKSAAQVICDRKSDPARGEIHHGGESGSPFSYPWPIASVPAAVSWRGSIVVPRTLIVPPGAELIVAPGTRVGFGRGSGLLVKGRIIAKGDPDAKIVFTSAQGKTPSQWDEIQLEYAVGSEISNCVFEYATWGLHSHFTKLTVSDSLFTNNYGGMRFRSGPVEIKRSTFQDNTIGIRAYLGNALISDNVITRNETGIFVREKGGGLTITRNDLSGNGSYGVRLGDFNNEDVNARGNWWGTDPTRAIYDQREEPGVGKVIFEPNLKEPLRNY